MGFRAFIASHRRGRLATLAWLITASLLIQATACGCMAGKSPATTVAPALAGTRKVPSIPSQTPGPTQVLTTAVDPTGSGTISPAASSDTYDEDDVVDVTADVAAIPTYDLTVAVGPAGGGTTDPAAGVHSYAAGSVVNVTAAPATGYTFSSWSGACTGSGTCSVTMDADKTVTANLVQSSGVASKAIPSNATPGVGQQVVVSIYIDMSGAAVPNNKLGSFTGSLDWDPAILTYSSNSGILAGFMGHVNTTDTGSGLVVFNGANVTGAAGDVAVLQITFDAVGAGTSALSLEYTAMASAITFEDLRPILTVTDGQVVVSPVALGEVNGDGLVNSTDVLIAWGLPTLGRGQMWLV